MDDIDPKTFHDLMLGLYTCYWCGAVEDIEHIGTHVTRCLVEINWLHKHVELASGVEPR